MSIKKIKKPVPTYRIGALLKQKFSADLINSGSEDMDALWKRVKQKAAVEIGLDYTTLNRHIKLHSGSGYDIPTVTKKAYATYFGIPESELLNSKNKKVKAA